MMEKLMGRDKGRQTTYQLLSQAKESQPGEH